MRFHNLLALCALTALVHRAAAAQNPDSAQAAQMRAMVEQIARDRPPQAEAAARELYARLLLQRAALDSLRTRSLAEYWSEVAQLTVQRQMLLSQQDSSKARLMSQLFASEAQARSLQRDFRDEYQTVPDSSRARNIRERLEDLITRHMAAEDSLRSLEIADVERRLVQIRADADRRKRLRTELVRQQVEQILRDATRPE
jgi:hypothetical protein